MDVSRSKVNFWQGYVKKLFDVEAMLITNTVKTEVQKTKIKKLKDILDEQDTMELEKAEAELNQMEENLTEMKKRYRKNKFNILNFFTNKSKNLIKLFKLNM